MSLFRKVLKGVKKVAKVGVRTLAATNPYAAAATSLIGTRSPSARMTMANSLGGVSSMSAFPMLAGGTLARVGGTLATTAGRLAGAAKRISRKHPAWVQNVLIAGGTIIAGMVYDKAGQAIGPVPKRPRSKGITARELKSFTRVTGILNKYCKTPPPTKRRSASRSRSCR